MTKPFTVKETRRVKKSEYGYYKFWDIPSGHYNGIAYLAKPCNFWPTEAYQKTKETNDNDAKLPMPEYSVED